MWRGVGDVHLERAPEQDLPDRQPVDPGRLHRHQRAFPRARSNPAGPPAPLSSSRKVRHSRFALPPDMIPHARHDAVLVNVQTRHTFVDDFHDRLLDERRRQGRA